ncbi:type IV toxin-antitoxin system AbiEi family antitoxin [Gordonia sp. VNK1]|uniref:type IV toxin-antitoxin system AbiEi family antitoxin n=1 Tax=Gordonia oleivorans TaxID=3156618 RepID=UPI0032B514D1
MSDVIPAALLTSVRHWLEMYGVQLTSSALGDLAENESRTIKFTIVGGEKMAVEGRYLSEFSMAGLGEIGRMSEGQRQAGTQVLVIAPYIHPRSAETLRSLNIWFADGAGNAYLRAPGLVVDVRGRSRPTKLLDQISVSRSRSSTLFTRKRSQVVAVILADPRLVDAPLRVLSECSGTSVGLVKNLMDDLVDTAFVEVWGEHRRPGNLVALLDSWAVSYANQVDTIFDGEGTVNPVVPKGTRLFLSGERAVPELIHHAPTLTAYVNSSPTQPIPVDLIRENRWRRSATPNVHLRRWFWNGIEGMHTGADGFAVAPTPIVYADLLGSNEERQREAAEGVRRGWIKAIEPTVASMRT